MLSARLTPLLISIGNEIIVKLIIEQGMEKVINKREKERNRNEDISDLAISKAESNQSGDEFICSTFSIVPTYFCHFAHGRKIL
jgi:hypothetical protein